MKRNEHLFQFDGKQISEAAMAEHDYHTQRFQWWTGEYALAVVKAKAAGVEIREHDVTGGKRAEVVLDPSVSARLSECTNKVASHRAAADRFQIEAAAYGTQPGRSYELQPDDVIYFRLAGSPRTD